MGLLLTPGVRLLVFLNAIVFMAQLTLSVDDAPITGLLTAQRDDILAGEAWRLLSAGFAHADFSHLFWNLLGLLFFGHSVERQFGTRYFLLAVLAAVLLGNAVHVIVFPSPCLGFSGANLMIFAAFASISPNAIIRLFFILPIRAWTLLLIIIGFDLYSASQLAGASPVANLVHLTGAVVGLVVHRWRSFLLKAGRGLGQAATPLASPLRRLRSEGGEAFHRCIICGVTEIDEPERRFRVCTECQPEAEYCDLHLAGHAHREDGA